MKFDFSDLVKFTKFGREYDSNYRYVTITTNHIISPKMHRDFRDTTKVDERFLPIYVAEKTVTVDTKKLRAFGKEHNFYRIDRDSAEKWRRRDKFMNELENELSPPRHNIGKNVTILDNYFGEQITLYPLFFRDDPVEVKLAKDFVYHNSKDLQDLKAQRSRLAEEMNWLRSNIQYLQIFNEDPSKVLLSVKIELGYAMAEEVKRLLECLVDLKWKTLDLKTIDVGELKEMTVKEIKEQYSAIVKGCKTKTQMMLKILSLLPEFRVSYHGFVETFNLLKLKAQELIEQYELKLQRVKDELLNINAKIDQKVNELVKSVLV